MTDPKLEIDGTNVSSATAADIALMRTMSPAQKLAKIGELVRLRREALFTDSKRRYPNDSDHDNMLRAVSRSIGPELMLKAYGWDVNEKGY